MLKEAFVYTDGRMQKCLVANGDTFHNLEEAFDKIHKDKYKPVKVEYDGYDTICTFSDGDIVKVTCTEDEPFIEEFGVAQCIIKKLFGSRTSFMKIVNNGHHLSYPTFDEQISPSYDEYKKDLDKDLKDYWRNKDQAEF